MSTIIEKTLTKKLIHYFYYSKLNTLEKKIYEIIYIGIKKHQKNISISIKGHVIKTNHIQKIIPMIIYDNPKFFYLKYKFSIISSNNFLILKPEYLYNEIKV
ncbi:MAG: hypothetical protein ABF289_02465, partial [Clostridiales bacterium]